MKRLPNVLTILRAGLSAAIVGFSLQDQWVWAFSLVVLGLVTDWAAGYIADSLNAKLDCDSLESVGDLIFAAGLVGGLAMTGHFWWLAAGMLAMIQIAFHLTLRRMNSNAWWCQFVHTVFIPFYVTTVLGLAAVYAFVAFGDQVWQWVVLAMPLVILATNHKRHRFGWHF